RKVYVPARLLSSENAAGWLTRVTVRYTLLKSTLRFTVKVPAGFVTVKVAGTVSPVTLLAYSCFPCKKKLRTTAKAIIASTMITFALDERRGCFLFSDCYMTMLCYWLFESGYIIVLAFNVHSRL